VADRQGTLPKARLDSLTDGVFAFAMTLLVLNLEIPDDYLPTSTADLLAKLAELRGSLLVYVISFVVLGIFWFGQAADRSGPKEVSGAHLWATLFLLFFTTVAPFSTQIVGRYNLPPAVWLYAANMILLSLSALAISYISERETGVHLEDTGRVDLVILIISAALSAAISLFTMEGAMWAYMLNFAATPVKRWLARGHLSGTRRRR
jgi:uncharacterized membrane protein